MLDIDDGDDLDEQVTYLARLTKSADRTLAEQAQDALDRLAKKYDPSQLRGPNGRWIHIGSPATGSRVHHPEHGHGTVTGFDGGNTHMRPDGAGFSHSSTGGTTHIRFDNGAEHSFEHAAPDRPGTHFKPRADVQAAAKKPVTDQEFADRAKNLEKVLDRETVAAHNTATLHQTNGVWNPERAKLHRQIVDDLYAQKAHVPNEGKAVIAGGLGGAGKTTTLKGHAGIDPANFLSVNPDDVKEEMAKRGMVPEVPGHPELTPMERATLIHQESGDIAQMLADRAYADQKNMIWDITMGGGAGWMKDEIGRMRDQHGYKDVRGVFVDIPAETSVERAMARYREGVNEHRAGKEGALGGRYVPPHIIRAQKTPDGSTINRGVFDSLAPSFDDWSVYDNSVTGRAPQLTASKG